MTIRKLRYQSFFINNKLIEIYNVIFVKIDEQWYHCSISDGKASFFKIDEPHILPVSNIKDEFKYPISDMERKDINKYILGNELLNLMLLVSYDNPYVEIGYKFLLNGNTYFTIYEDLNEETLKILINQELSEKVTSKKFKIK